MNLFTTTPTKRTTTTISSTSANSTLVEPSTTPQQQQQQQQQQRTPTTTNYTNRILSPVSPIATEAEREQALRDYKVTIEYKHLKSHAPGGVYIVPSIRDDENSIRKFYGVIFVRRGPYMNGIFQFTLELPPRYNDINTHPMITFTSRVYSPYVDPNTGQLDVLTMYPRWDPARHYLVTILTCIKKIFYTKTFDDAKANIEAKELAIRNPNEFMNQIHSCVTESNTNLYNNNNNSNNSTSTIRFTEETICHGVLRDLLKESVKDPNTISQQMIFHCIEESSKSSTSTTTTTST